MAKKKEENATVNTQEIKTKFQQKMGELLEIAKKKRNILEYQEISDHFKELNLDAEQFEAVLDFLEHNNVDVLRMNDDDDDDDEIILDDDDEVEVENIDLSVPDGVSAHCTDIPIEGILRQNFDIVNHDMKHFSEQLNITDNCLCKIKMIQLIHCIIFVIHWSVLVLSVLSSNDCLALLFRDFNVC